VRFIICGYGGHGKGELCKTLGSYFGLHHNSSSFIAKEQVYSNSKLLQSKYHNAGDAHKKRRSDRSEWYKQIQAINADDKTTLARLLFTTGGCTVYDGMRCREELRATLREFSPVITIWVYNPTVKIEERTSCTIRAADCDLVIMNSGTLPELQRKVIKVFSEFKGL